MTWAYRFVILEVSGKPGRHYMRNPPAALDAGQRNASSRVIFDARRKIRRALAANGYLDEAGLEQL